MQFQGMQNDLNRKWAGQSLGLQSAMNEFRNDFWAFTVSEAKSYARDPNQCSELADRTMNEMFKEYGSRQLPRDIYSEIIVKVSLLYGRYGDQLGKAGTQRPTSYSGYGTFNGWGSPESSASRQNPAAQPNGSWYSQDSAAAGSYGRTPSGFESDYSGRNGSAPIFGQSAQYSPYSQPAGVNVQGTYQAPVQPTYSSVPPMQQTPGQGFVQNPTQPYAQPVQQPVMQQTVSPVQQPVVQQPVPPVQQPIMQQVPPVQQPIIQQPVVQPVVPPVQPVMQTVVRPAVQQQVQPTVQQVQQPVQQGQTVMQAGWTGNPQVQPIGGFGSDASQTTWIASGVQDLPGYAGVQQTPENAQLFSQAEQLIRAYNIATRGVAPQGMMMNSVEETPAGQPTAPVQAAVQSNGAAAGQPNAQGKAEKTEQKPTTEQKPIENQEEESDEEDESRSLTFSVINTVLIILTLASVIFLVWETGVLQKIVH